MLRTKENNMTYDLHHGREKTAWCYYFHVLGKKTKTHENQRGITIAKGREKILWRSDLRAQGKEKEASRYKLRILGREKQCNAIILHFRVNKESLSIWMFIFNFAHALFFTLRKNNNNNNKKQPSMTLRSVRIGQTENSTMLRSACFHARERRKETGRVVFYYNLTWS